MKTKKLLLVASLLLVGCSIEIDSSNSQNDTSSELSSISENNSSINSLNSQDSTNSLDSTNNESSSTTLNSSSSESKETNSYSSTSVQSPSLTSSENSSNSSSSTQIEVIDNKKNPAPFKKYPFTYQNQTSLVGEKVNPSTDAFSVEGYATNVTGGGELAENDANYIKVSTAQEFIKAIGRKNYDDKSDTSYATRSTVIEVLNDIDLGWNNLSSEVQNYSDVIKANDASTHPLLKQTGVSVVYLTGRQNLTIFSKNGAKLSHACFQIRGFSTENRESKNIIIRNLQFDGIWEWDDSGKYDNNDWDQFTIRGDAAPVHHIWIDHCTFKKTYDGTIDIKYGATDITISWCSFIPYTKEDEEFMQMMNYLENNRSSFPNYNAARSSGATFEDLIQYASINKKVHLVGHSDNNAGDENIRVTYCNNYYLDCVERLPRLRLGNVHVYNNIYDASSTESLKMKVRGLASWPKALGFSENGSQSTNYGHSLLENCYINGINTPLRNNMKKVENQYVGTIEALYTYYTCQNISRSWDYSNKTNTDVSFNGRYTFKGDSTPGEENNLLRPFPMAPLSFDTHEFKMKLGYEYTLYEPEELYIIQNNKVGANAINFDTLWLRSSYTNEIVEGLILPTNGVKGKTTNLNKIRK